MGIKQYDEDFFIQATEDVKINIHNLHEQWIVQPHLYSKYATALADFRRELTRAKDKEVMVKAQIRAEILSDPVEYLGQGVKVINDNVDACIISQEDYKEVRTQVVTLTYRCDVLDGLLRSLQQKKDALQELVRLMGMEYFAAPTTPKELRVDGDYSTTSLRSESAKRVKTRRIRKGEDNGTD